MAQEADQAAAQMNAMGLGAPEEEKKDAGPSASGRSGRGGAAAAQQEELFSFDELMN